MEMRYWVRVGDRDFEVVLREREGGATVLVDGREMGVQLEQGSPGIYALLVEGRPYDLAIAPRSGGFSVAVGGVPFDVVVEDARQRRLASVGASKTVTGDRVALRAPMPGLVIQIDVAEGDQVEAGQRLVVLEAMKMENDLVAPRAGLIAQVKVTQGQTVEQGQLLITIE